MESVELFIVGGSSGTTQARSNLSRIAMNIATWPSRLTSFLANFSTRSRLVF
jgi:hypothetical protein